MPGVDSAYLCPAPFEADGDNRELATSDSLLAWAKDVVSDGRSYLRLQPAYPFIADGIDMVNGESPVIGVGTLSKMRTDQTVRNAKELIAAQTNIRIIPAFKSEMEEFRQQTTILNKSFMAWQTSTFADRRLRKAWQYAEAAGTGYIGTRYDPNYWYRGKGDIVWDAYGPLDVLPVGMGRQHDLQKAYTVALRVATPVHEAWRLFPLYVDRIKPSRDAHAGHGTVISQAVKFATAVLKRFGQGTRYEHEPAPWAMVDVYYIYVDDDSVNDTGEPVKMRGPDGIPGTSWSYEVPFVGQKIDVGDGRFREAGREDCLLYPNRRLIIAVGTDMLGVIVNPDPECQASPYWHGKVPLAQLRADDWAWNFLGFPITRYGQSLERASIEMWRGMVDAMNARLSPPRAFDRNSQGAALAQTINTRIPNQVVGLDLSLVPLAQQMGPLLPYQWYEYPPHYLQAQQMLVSMMKDQMGVADAQALARARQLPSGDSVEKLMEQLGPLVKDQSRNMEESIRALGEQWKSNFFQFYTVQRRMQLLGPDGLAEEDFDYKPGTLIPYANDQEWSSAGAPDMRSSESRRKFGAPEEWERYFARGEVVPQFERARWHKDNFAFSVVPYSLHEFNSISRKLFYVQLQARGFPLDPWTLAELFDIKNFGDLPNIPDPNTGGVRKAQTIIERWIAWMEMQSRFHQALAAAGGQGQAGVGPGAGGGRPGRPPTAQQPPTMENKGGVRPIIRESKH
jgi:hypothetical protein